MRGQDIDHKDTKRKRMMTCSLGLKLFERSVQEDVLHPDISQAFTKNSIHFTAELQ